MRTSLVSPVTDSITTVSFSIRWTTAQQEMAEWRQPSPSACACSPPCCRAPHPQSLRVVQKCCFAAVLCPAVEFQRLSREIQVKGTGFLQRHETQVHTAKPITGVIVHLCTIIDIARLWATASWVQSPLIWLPAHVASFLVSAFIYLTCTKTTSNYSCSHHTFKSDLLYLVLICASRQQLVVGLADSSLSDGQRRRKQREWTHLQPRI